MNKRIIRIALAAAGAAAVVALIIVALTRPRPPLAPPQHRPPRPPPHVEVPLKGVIAIVIDDVGYTSGTFELYSQIRQPITLSVLPHLAFSNQAAERFHSKFEIILHLPMEPKTPVDLEPRTILTSMKADDIRSILDDDLENLKYVSGVSNHMGSKATEDQATMDIVLGELRKRGLFFLDSVTSGKTAVRQAARTEGVRLARRDVFLDNKREAAAIRERLEALKRRARANGHAIGIGHDRKVTLEVLREELPRMAEEGYKFVYVSDLAEK